MPPTPPEPHQLESSFLKSTTPKALVTVAVAMAVVYFLVLAFLFPRGNQVLFWLLMAGEIFHIWQIATYVYTVWDQPAGGAPYRPVSGGAPALPADVFITVTGEPTEVVEATARAALRMNYPAGFNVYLLNDGKIAKKPNWREAESLAKRLGIACITRQKPGGAKAGNINHALRLTRNPLVVVFDADQMPRPDFLKKSAAYFSDPEVGFVQSPQYYKNFNTNEITRGAWEQQELFFGPICKGKNRLNSAFLCGTNMAIRRAALEQAGGMFEKSIAEDFLTSLFLHERGWKSIYIPEILAEGLAPEDFLSYYKQQFRWARGSLEMVFRYNPLLRRGLTWHQKIQYLASASYYLSGLVVLLNALLPLVFFFTGQVPLIVSTMGLTAIFLPYIFLVILTLRLTSNYSYTFRALSFSMASFPIHIQALWAVLTNQNSGFSVTAKKKLDGNFLYLSAPHLLYIAAALLGMEWGYLRDGLTAPLLTNMSWALFNIMVFLPFVFASGPWAETARQQGENQPGLKYAEPASESVFKLKDG